MFILAAAWAMPLTANENLPLLVDADGDGWTDIVVDNGRGVFYNEAGTYGPIQPLGPSTMGALAAMADFTGDGFPELCSIEPDGLLCREGQGRSFGAALPLAPLPALPGHPIDADGDGDLDLLITATWNNTSTIMLYENDGSGAFTATPLAEGRVSTWGWGDIDGDGDQELLAWIAYDGERHWLEVTSSGVTYGGKLSELGATTLGMVDITGDGIPDMLSSDTVGYSYYFEALSVGDYGPHFPLDYDGHIATPDLDGDGGTDIVMSTRYDGLMWDRSAAGSFALVDVVDASSEHPADPGRVHTVDLDQDGILDVVYQQGFLRVLTDPLGSPTGETLQHPASWSYAVAIGELNQDSWPDVAVATDGELVWFAGVPDRGFGRRMVIDEEISPKQMFLADFTGDGISDIATLSHATVLSLREGLGGGTFAAKRFMAVDVRTALAYDVDSDGTSELFLGTADGSINLLSTAGTQPVALLPGLVRDLAYGDVTGDGVADVLGLADTMVHVFEGPAYVPSQSFEGGHDPTALALFDPNGDGLLDVAVGSACRTVYDPFSGNQVCEYETNEVRWAENAFGVLQPTVLMAVGYDSPLVVADWDQDGLDDIVVPYADGVVALHPGQAPLDVRTRNHSGQTIDYLASGDLDNDGYSEVVASGKELADVLWNGEPIVPTTGSTTSSTTTETTPETESPADTPTVDTAAAQEGEAIDSPAQPEGKAGGCGCAQASGWSWWSLLPRARL